MKINRTEQSCAHDEGLLFEIHYAGCEHKCKGCYVPELWDPKNGREMSVSELVELSMKNAIDGVCLLGGDPLYQAQDTAVFLAALRDVTGLPVKMFTGYTREEISADPNKEAAFNLCDSIITGRYDEAKRNVGKIGSSNQRAWRNERR